MQKMAAGPARFRFGAYEVDVRAGELRKHGFKIKLQDQPLQVLVMLLLRRGELVTREEFREQLWPSEFVDFDHGLNTAVARLREALGDAAENPRFIETVAKRGYRFIGSPALQGDGATRASRTMLAVLPFENLSAKPDEEYFADGLTEEMIARLGRIAPEKLGVIARVSAMQYKGTLKAASEIGGELGVDFIVESSVRRAGDRVRIVAKLISVSDQSNVWGQDYDRTMGVEDILGIQSDVASRIAQALALQLLPSQKQGMERSAPRSAAAYEAFLKGRHCWNKRTEEWFHKALEYFQTATEKDPDYAPAYVGVADVHNVRGLYGYVQPRESYEQAKAASQKALQLDESLAEAHTSLAYATFLYGWNWAEAEKEFRLAQSLNPNYVPAQYWYAQFLSSMGRFDEAEERIRKALELDPVSMVTSSHCGWMLYFARRYDESIERLRRALEIEPAFPLARYFLGMAYAQKKMYREAIVELKEAADTTGHPAVRAMADFSQALMKSKAEARRAKKGVEEAARKSYVSSYILALVALGMGDQDEALDYLEKTYEERSPWITNLGVEPALDSLAPHPRFQELLKRVGLTRKTG